MRPYGAAPLADTVDAEPEDDLEFALIQMKSEMLETVDEAVRDALALRCLECEEARDYEQRRERYSLTAVAVDARLALLTALSTDACGTSANGCGACGRVAVWRSVQCAAGLSPRPAAIVTSSASESAFILRMTWPR